MQSTGIQVIRTDDKVITAIAHLLFMTGDLPAAATLCNYKGHMSLYGCRICEIKMVSLRSRKGKGYGQYFLGRLDSNDAI